jgi:large subunit ribosomal protein L22
MKYSIKAKGENTSRAMGVGLRVSPKYSTEIARYIRGKKLEAARMLLTDIIALRRALPLKRFKRKIGHKPGMASGKYPVKACGEILKVINTAEANARFKGLHTQRLFIRHIVAKKGSNTTHFGRRRQREMKNTHIEVILEEEAEKTPVPKSSKGEESKKSSQSKAMPQTSSTKSEPVRQTKKPTKSTEKSQPDPKKTSKHGSKRQGAGKSA